MKVINETEVNKIANHPIQSRQWGEFRKSWGNEVLFTKYGIITVHRIPLTPYKIGIFEKGPKPGKTMLSDLQELGKKDGLIFIKLEPNIPVFVNSQAVKNNPRDQLTKLLINAGAVAGKTLFTPTTFWIDLTKSDEELMKSFSSKTRYNIRLAQRKGVKIAEDNSDKAFEKYLDLTFETTNRQGFYAHTPKYHRLMWEHLHKKMVIKKERPIAHLLTARYNNEIITTWVLFTWKGSLYYPYGASTDKYRDVMANNLMMWEAIKFGKKLGLKTFDLWGREEGKGFTKFKEGYNPKVVEFLGTWDLIINPVFYKLYRFAEKARWSVLHLKNKIKINLRANHSPSIP